MADSDKKETTLEKISKIPYEYQRAITPEVINNFGDDIKYKLSKHLNADDRIKRMYSDPNNFMQSESSFVTPEMGDFYLGAIDDTYLKKIDSMVNGKDPDNDIGDGENAAFYAEAPVMNQPGYKNGAYFLRARANVSDDDIDNGLTDGNKVSIKLGSITGGKVKGLSNKFKSSLNPKENYYEDLTDGNNITLRLYGISCPSTAKWARENSVPTDSIETKSMSVEEASNDSSCVFAKGVHDNNETLTMAFIAGKWREIDVYGKDSSDTSFRWCVSGGDENRESAMRAAKKIQSLIKNAGGEVYILVDENSNGFNESNFEESYDTDMAAELKKMAGKETHNGINGYSIGSQNIAGRISGVAYIKQDGKWINLAKAALCDTDNKDVKPDTDYHGAGDDTMFNTGSYDKDSKNYADAYFNAAMLADDRGKIQKEIFGKDFDSLREWTVTIGDVTLFVPPVNISAVTQLDDERVPLLRANGSMSKSGKRVYRMIQMEIFFNDDKGINGYEYKAKTPMGKELTYYMNGLRSLEAQFKFVPYVPLENNYINEVLGVDAVIMNSISINSVPGFPRLIKATVTMTEFDYTVYMPELVASSHSSESIKNIFSTSFNWPIMRYYYQRCLARGNEIASKDYNVNSQDYIKMSLKNRTSLQPLKFKSSDMSFFIADSTFLEKMLKAKMLSDKGLNSQIDNNKEALKSIRGLAELNENIHNALNDETVKEELNKLNAMAPFGIKESNALYGNMRDGAHNIYMNDDKNPWFSSGTVHNTCTGQLIDGKICNTEEVEQQMNVVLNAVQEKLKGCPNVSSIRVTTYHSRRSRNDNDANSNAISFGLAVQYKDDFVSDSSNVDNLKNDCGPAIDAEPSTFFNNNQIFIPFTMNFSQQNENNSDSLMNDSGFFFNTAAADMRFLNYCSEQAKNHEEQEGKEEGTWMKAANLKQLDNMPFIPYDTGKFKVMNWQASLSNRTSKINICDVSGSTPQYLGGEDVVFHVDLLTTDKKAVSSLINLPKVASNLTRRYRAVIPCFPVKIDSEFTHFFGVDEAALENVRVDTIPNMPNMWAISMDMRSLDRTLRNREALEMIEADNSGARYTEELSEKNIQSYFDMQKNIAQAELYPDLELPTIAEMQIDGWEFVRYKFQDNRVYVDPDFYFLYMFQLSSQITRELLLNSIKSGVDGTTEYTDATGAKVVIVPEKEKGFSIAGMNPIAEAQNKKIKDAKDAKYKVNTKQLAENLSKEENAPDQESFEGWDISPDIKAVFLERNYKKEFDSYCARGKANEVGVEDGSGGDNATAETSYNNGAEDNKSATQDAAAPKTAVQEAAAALTNPKDSKKTTEEDPTSKRDTENAVVSEGTTVADEDIEGQIPPTIMGKDSKTEGAWVNAQLGNAYEAGLKIDDFLKNVPITYDVPDKSPILAAVESEKTKGGETNMADSMIKTQIDAAVVDFLNLAPVSEILKLLCVDTTDTKLLPIVKGIIYSAACAATGDKEFSNKKKATNWKPNPVFIAETVGSLQDAGNMSLASTTEEGVKYGVRFGCFGIKQYTREEFENVTEKYPESPWETEDTVNTSHFLIDPYYRNLTEPEIEQYKKGCINSPQYCCAAFMRICLFWMGNLISNQAIPSINADILRNTAKMEVEIQTAQKDNKVSDAKSVELLNHIAYFTKNSYAVDAGKFWTVSMLAATDGDSILRHRIHDRDYRGLNGYFSGVTTPNAPVPKEDEMSMTMRKMGLALVGQDIIKDFNATGIDQTSSAVSQARDMREKKYIDAAEDPTQYTLHACHDMIVNDARGRMLRAFPTYYMLFIDEGRDVGLWHLHDNFYNNMSIMEITVVKSRKLPADTADIKISNVYQSFTTEEEDMNRHTDVGVGRTILSIFSPTSEGKTEEEERKQRAPETRTRLRPGARIHLRMGYGSNAAMMPVVFNGCIAEVNAQEVVNIIAQGDGVELLNPIMDDEQAHEVTGVEKGLIGDCGAWYRNGCTPKDIMNHLLTTRGGSMNTLLKSLGFPNLLGTNPYGIYHFGDPEFNDIFKTGEPTQNIFEACAKPAWGQNGDITSEYAGHDAPVITLELFNKTIWDIANICKSVSPDFVCGITPFGFRSTIFIGAPRYYYAYDYININGSIQEKRKPFQQYHIYTSSTDIIGNGICATKRDMKTVATGLYTVCASLNTKEQHRVGPIYADIDIFPEEQKSMVVDTQLLGKGLPIIGLITNAVSSIEAVDDLFDDKGVSHSHKKIAWRMTASKLKESIKDMYCGDMVVLGDPSVKPHDRIYILDNYEGISGQATVKEVTMSMSVESGFTTTISPDCIVDVDDPHEKIVHQWFSQTGGMAAACLLGTMYTALSARYSKVLGMKDTLSYLKPTRFIQKLNKMSEEKRNNTEPDTPSSPSVSGVREKAVEGATMSVAGKMAPNLFTSGVKMVLATASNSVVGKFISSKLQNFLRNLQAVTIYPLKKYGITWTAGFEGSKGCIVGSPTYNEQGILTRWTANLAGTYDNGVINFMTGLFVNDDAKKFADKLKRDAGVTDSNGEYTMPGDSFDNALKGVAQEKGSAGGDNVKRGYRQMQLSPRADYSKGNDVLLSYNHFAITETDQYHNSPKMQYNKLISTDSRITPYIDEGFFKIIHETPALNKGDYVDTQNMNIDGHSRYVKVIKYQVADGSQVCDLPMLNKDAIDILYEIIRRAKNNMPAANASDKYESYDETKDSFIALESALRVGDTESQAAAGFTFILEAVKNAAQPMAAAIKELHDEVSTDAQNNSIMNAELFDTKEIGEDKVAIVVRMPRVSGANDNEKSDADNTENNA